MVSLAKLQTILLVLAAFVCVSAHSQTFTNPVRVATPVDPDAVLSGDLNGDGRVDLIWLGVTATNTVGHIELAQANGGYLPARTFTIPGVPTSIPMCVTADVTGDGKLDVICATLYNATQSKTVLVFPGNGDGTLAAPISTQLSNQSGDTQAILLASVGDLNADGIPDFVLEDDYYTPAMVLLSDGQGGFLPPKSVAASYNYSVPIAADVNGDGIPDILWPQGAVVALGRGDGSFAALTPSPFPESDGPVYCSFHDMDGDGKLDAVCGRFPSNESDAGTVLDILHGNGDGSFNPAPIFHTTFGSSTIDRSGSGDFLVPEAISDVNGDGIPDILAYAGDGLTVLLGQPGLKFGSPMAYALAYSGYDFATRAAALRQYVDLNGDGLLDVLTAGPNGMYLILGHADGTFGSALATKVSEVNGHIAVADFNGDGKPDVVSTGAPGTSLSFGNGDGTFASPSAIQGAPFAAGAEIYVADFNGDGKADLLSSDPSMAPYLMLGRGDGTFNPAIAASGLPALNPPSSTDGYTVRYDLTADLNSDGKSDVFLIDTDTSSPTYSLVSALSTGDGSFRIVRTTYPAPAGYHTPVAPVLGDFAQRGQLDAAYFAAENIYVVRGHGDGSFDLTPTVLSIPTVAGQQADQFQALQTGDFDGDGRLDLAFLSWFQPAGYSLLTGPSCVFIYFGNGDGTFKTATQAGCYTHAYTDFRVADVNGDGRPDLVMQASFFGNNYVVGVAQNLGSRTFGPDLNYTAGSLSGDLFVSDLNLDGRPDLVFGNQRYEAGYSANSVTVLLNTGAPTATGTLTSTPNPSYIGQAFNITASLRPPNAGTTYTGDITFYVDGNSIGTAALSGNVATIVGPPTLSARAHQLSATWPGDANDPSITFTATQTVLQLPLQVSLTCSPNPSNIGQTVTLATQFMATPPPGLPASTAPYTGILSFYDGNTLLGQKQVASEGFGFDVSTLPAGTHSILASYASDSVFAPATASCSQVVTAIPTISTLSVLPEAATYGAPVTLTATVAPATQPGPSIPTGTVTFYNGESVIGSGTLVNGVGTTTISNLSGGTDSLTCTYSGNSVYATSACNTVAVTIAAAATALALTTNLNPAPALTTVTVTAHLAVNNGPAAAGNVIALTLNGQTVSLTTDTNGTATFSIDTLTPGTYPVTASFAGTGDLSASSAAFTEVVTPIVTATRLTVTPSPAYFSQLVTVVANISAQAPSSAVPVGSASFFDGTTLIGTQPVTAAGIATLTISTLAIGTHSITAMFNPANTVFAGSTSPGFDEVILPSGFTVTLSPASITLQPGATGTAAIQLASVGNFAGSLALTYGSLPKYATASIDPTAVTLTGGGAGSSTFTLNTLLKAPNKTSARIKSTHLPVIFAAIVVFFVPIAFLRRKVVPRLLGLILALFALQAMTGCTNTSYTADVVAPGTYQLPITATDLNHNSQTATLTIVIEP